MRPAFWCGVAAIAMALLVLTGCGGTTHGHTSRHGTPEIAVGLTDADRKPLADPVAPVTRPWRWLSGGPGNDAMHVTVRLTIGDGADQAWSAERAGFTAVGEVAQPADAQAGAARLTEAFAWESPAVTLTFHPRRAVLPDALDVQGDVQITPHAEFVQRLVKAFGDRPSLVDLLGLGFRKVSAESIAQYAGLIQGLKLEEAVRLANHRVKPESIRALRDAGYRFDAAGYIRLDNHGVKPAEAIAFRSLGFDYGVDQLIRLDNYNIRPEEAAAFRDTGFARSIDDFIRMDNYNVKPAFAATMRDLGIARSIDDLIRLDNYNIDPEDVRAWQQAGYQLSIDELIRAGNYNLKPAVAGSLRSSGYDLGIDDLIRLSQYNAEDLALSLADPAFEPLTVEQIIRLKQRGFDPASVAALRQPRRPAAE